MTAQRPNILWYCTDQQRYDTIGALNNRFVDTPNIDRLVGASLDLVHSPHPLCVPARRAKQIVTIHDLFFLKHPEMTRAEVRRDYAPLVRQNVARADGVICVSATAGVAEIWYKDEGGRFGLGSFTTSASVRERRARMSWSWPI